MGCERERIMSRVKNRRNRCVGSGSIEPLEGRLLLAIINSLIDPLTGAGVDTTKWAITDRGLENNGPAGYNAPQEDANGLVLGGTTNQQYWFGSSLESVDDFSSQATTAVSVDRVALSGSGTAYRSSLWLLQPGGQFLHFSQNVGETGWQYNQTVGGSGTGIGAFNTAAPDQGQHAMKLVYTPLGGSQADVSVYLDGVLGPTVHFTNWSNSTPFKVIMTGQGRAIGDSVSATFKNFSAVAEPVPTLPPAAPTNLVATAAPKGLNVSLSWGDNANNEINYRVERSSDGGATFTEIASVPAVAGSGTTATYNEVAPAAGTQFTYRVRAFNNANGGSFSGYSNVASATTAPAVSSLSDPLTGAGIDTTKWDVTDRGLESTGPAGYTASEDATGLTLGGTATAQYWYGKSIESKDVFLSQKTTTVTVDRVSLNGIGTAYRSSLWLLQPTAGGQFFHIAQNIGETGWQYNQTAGNVGTGIATFNGFAADPGLHKLKLVYRPTGSRSADIDMYLDDVSGGTVTFNNWDTTVPFKVILTGQARAIGDSVSAVFQNIAVAADALPAAAPAAPSNLLATPVVPGRSVNLTWTDNSENELEFRVERSIDGTNFVPIATLPQSQGTGGALSYTDTAPPPGVASFYRVRAFNYANLGAYSTPSNVVTFVADPVISSLVDPFTADQVNTDLWDVTERGLENTGFAGYDAPVESPGGVTLSGRTSLQYWYGSSLESKGLFSSQVPTGVSVDRVALSGSGSAYRSSLWLLQPGGQFLHFSQNVGENGWQYNQTGGGGGTTIGTFNTAASDQGLHTMKLVYTPLGGTTADVAIYLDNVLGTTVRFTNWDNLVPFKVILTGQARAASDTVSATFQNFSAQTLSPLTNVSGTAGADSFYVKRNANGQFADVWVNSATPGSGNPTQQVPLDGRLVINGLAGNDLLRVDYSAGSPVPAGGIVFNGGDGTDTIRVNGAGPADAFGVSGASLAHLGGGTLSLGTDVERISVAQGNFAVPVAALAVNGGSLQGIDVGTGATVRVFYSGDSPVQQLRALLAVGYAGGTWAGPGISSSDAAANPGYSLGYADDGGNVVTVKYTRSGDANLDGRVDFTDLVAMAQNYNTLTGQAVWSAGDFTYDGNVDFNDLVLLAQNYNQGAAAPVMAMVAALAPAAKPVTAAATPRPIVKKSSPVSRSPFASRSVIVPPAPVARNATSAAPAKLAR
jgi:hypothetical protein